MGAQAFGSDTLMLDMMPLDKVLILDPDKGVVEVEAGVGVAEVDRSSGHRAERQSGVLGTSRRSKRAPTASAWVARWRPMRTAGD